MYTDTAIQGWELVDDLDNRFFGSDEVNRNVRYDRRLAWWFIRERWIASASLCGLSYSSCGLTVVGADVAEVVLSLGLCLKISLFEVLSSDRGYGFFSPDLWVYIINFSLSSLYLPATHNIWYVWKWYHCISFLKL